MPLLIRIVTGLVAGGLLYTAAFFGDFGQAVVLGIIAVVWVIIGLTLAARWEDIE